MNSPHWISYLFNILIYLFTYLIFNFGFDKDRGLKIIPPSFVEALVNHERIIRNSIATLIAFFFLQTLLYEKDIHDKKKQFVQNGIYV